MGSALETEGSKYPGVGKTGMLGKGSPFFLCRWVVGDQNVQDYCFKGGTKINEQHPDVASLMFLAALG